MESTGARFAWHGHESHAWIWKARRCAPYLLGLDMESTDVRALLGMAMKAMLGLDMESTDVHALPGLDMESTEVRALLGLDMESTEVGALLGLAMLGGLRLC